MSSRVRNGPASRIGWTSRSRTCRSPASGSDDPARIRRPTTLPPTVGCTWRCSRSTGCSSPSGATAAELPPEPAYDGAELVRIVSRGFLVRDLDATLAQLATVFDWYPAGDGIVEEDGCRTARMAVGVPHSATVQISEPVAAGDEAAFMAAWGPGPYDIRISVGEVDSEGGRSALARHGVPPCRGRPRSATARGPSGGRRLARRPRRALTSTARRPRAQPRGRPSPRSLMMLRMISLLPPAIVYAFA